jgi:PAS domain S-box-containing protein
MSASGQATTLVMWAVWVLGAVAVLAVYRLRRRQLVAEVARAEQQRDLAADVGDVLQWEFLTNGRVTYAGSRLREHFGYEVSELGRLNVLDLVEPADADRLAEYLRSGVGWTNERWRCVHKDGTRQWFVASAAPVRTAEGKVVSYRASSRRLGQNHLDHERLSELASSVRDRIDQPGGMHCVYQPILSVVTGRLIGAEALCRFPGSERDPEAWFAASTEVGLGVELDLAAIRLALRDAGTLPPDVYLSINLSPDTLNSPELMAVLLSADIAPDRLVMEITEHASILDYDDFLPAAEMLRSHGVRIAIDDAGAGYASFRHILRLAPEFIKLDRSLVSGINTDPAKRALVAAVVMFGLEMKATIIAEGLEVAEELRALQDLGIDAAQGNLFGRPVQDWGTWNEWHRRGPLYSVTAANRSSSATMTG